MAHTVSDKRLPADLPDSRDLTQVPDKYRPLLDDLFAAIARYNPDPDRELITRAFVAACVLHGRQSRKSGEGYIHHPVGTALNAAELKLDSVTVAAALLHDVVEDTGTPLSWIEDQFGAEIAMLVDGVTKLTKMHFTSQEEEQAENYRKMIVAMATDIRVILIKLCDRLHNMHTLCYLSKQKQIQKAKETLEVYARVDLERLLGLLDLLLLAEIAERVHVVQTVAELDEDDADVGRHRDDHLAVVLGLLLLLGGEVHLGELGDPVDQHGDLFAELVLDPGGRRARVFDDVVQQRRGHGDRVELELGGVEGGADGVVDVGLAALAALPAVADAGGDERPGD